MTTKKEALELIECPRCKQKIPEGDELVADGVCEFCAEEIDNMR